MNSRSRWLESRHPLIGMGLCVMSYVPAVWPNENRAAWVSVFGGIATVFIGGALAKNGLDSWRLGRYRPVMDPSDFPEES